MNENPIRVAHIEDSENQRKMVFWVLEKKGIIVAAMAENLNDAIELIGRLVELGISIVIVDGNLTQFDGSGVDGALITKLIREQAPGVKTVGLSNSKDGVTGADINVSKSDGPMALLAAIHTVASENVTENQSNAA